MFKDYKNISPFLLLISLSVAFAVSVYYEIVPTFSALIATIGGSVAVFNYISSVRIKRLEWLLQLFHRYMDEKKFRRIRYIIVFRVSPDYETLRDLMEHRDERKVDQTSDNFEKSLIMDMDDYLNFFELIATLWSKGELNKNEIEMLYHDYLRYLWQIDFTHAYINRWGFEALTQLATELFGPGPLADNTKPTSNLS